MSDIEELPTWVRDNQAYWVDLTAVDSSEHGVQRAKPIKANVGGSANVMSSSHSQYPDRHKVMLDLDVRHKLIPSTTPGHSHLYLDVDLSSDDYERLLNALRDAGIIQQGILAQYQEHGATFLRLPSVKKKAGDASS